MEITITKSMLKLTKITSKNDTRKELEHIFFDKENKVAVATDGHVLGKIPLKDEIPYSFLIHADDFKHIKTECILNLETSILSESETLRKTIIKIDKETKYPNWMQVTKPFKPVYRIGISLKKLSQLYSAIQDTSYPYVCFEFNDDGMGCIKFSFENEPGELSGIIMPSKLSKLKQGVLK